MTVANNNRRAGPYAGNGATTQFSYGFMIESVNDLVVLRRDANTFEKSETLLNFQNDYTVSGVNDSGGGTVTLAVAPTSEQQVIILGRQPIQQSTEYQGISLTSNALQNSIDRLARMLQEVNEQNRRAFTASRFSTAGTDNGIQVQDFMLTFLTATTQEEARNAIAAAAGSVFT